MQAGGSLAFPGAHARLPLKAAPEPTNETTERVQAMFQGKRSVTGRQQQLEVASPSEDASIIFQ